MIGCIICTDFQCQIVVDAIDMHGPYNEMPHMLQLEKTRLLI